MINKVIENKAKEGTPYERLLGSSREMNKIAEFWEKNAKLIHLIATDELIKYCEGAEFTSEEVSAFKLGLGRVGAAMQSCWEERQKKIAQVLPKDSKN